MIEFVDVAMNDWEKMNAETAYDKAEFPQMETYLFDMERVHEVIEDACGLEDNDLTEEVAVCVYDHIHSEEIRAAVQRWFRKADANDYNEWYKARNNYDEE